MSLSNKVILVSGANRGIGATTVRELLKANVAKVYAGARNVKSLPDFAKDIPLEKVTAEHAAVNIVRGIEQGQTYIFPDPMAPQIEHLWANDGHQLEVAMQVGG